MKVDLDPRPILRYINFGKNIREIKNVAIDCTESIQKSPLGKS